MNCSGKYLKVWKKQEQNGFTKLDLGDSRKMKDGTYKNWTWFGCTPVGKAKEVEVNEGDTIEIISGQVSQDKSGDKWYTNITIFDFEVTKKGENAVSDEIVEINDTEGLPF